MKAPAVIELRPVCWTLLIGIQGQTARDMLRNSSGVRPSSRIWRRLVSNARCTSRTLGRGRTHPSSGRRPARSPRCPGSCPCGSWTGGCRGVRARPATIGAGTAIPYLPYHRLHVRPGHVRRARQVVVVRGFRQPGYPQEVVEPVSPPCEQSDDGASLAPRDLDARRARSFPGTRPSPSGTRPVRRAPARASVRASA